MLFTYLKLWKRQTSNIFNFECRAIGNIMNEKKNT